MSLTLPVASLVAVYGFVVGSFLNVLIYRFPAGRTLLGRSYCPQCDNKIKWFDNIPVISWLLLRGKCRNCKSKISLRYPLVEAFTAATWFTATLTLGITAVLPVYLLAIAISITLAIIDYDTMRLPDPLVLIMTGLVVLIVSGEAYLSDSSEVLVHAALGALALGGFYFLIWLATLGRGMGFGDVKLAPSLGALLGLAGFGSLIVGAMSAWMIGGALVILGWLAGRVGKGKHVPFGPFLLGGAWIGFLWGEPLANSYLRLFGLA